MNYEELKAAYERRGQELLECAAELAQCRKTCLDGDRLFYFREELEVLRDLHKAVFNPPHLLFEENHSYIYQNPEIVRCDQAMFVWEAWWKDLFDRFGGPLPDELPPRKVDND